MLPHYKVTAEKRMSQLVKYEMEPSFTRETFTLKAGEGSVRKALLGTLLAMTYGAGAVSASVTAAERNTGDGALQFASSSHTSAVQHGDYTVVCSVEGGDGVAQFQIEDPAGRDVGIATAGAPFGKQIKFTISAGTADFVVGDSFVVSVSKDIGDPTNKVVPWDPEGADGTDRIWGVSLVKIHAPVDQDSPDGLAMRRGPTILYSGQIEWPEQISVAQKTDAITQLEAMGILVR